MANGKLVYTPLLSQAISLPETKYLELADTAALDVGTGDFSFSCIFYMDSTITNTTAYKLLVGKGALDLSSLAGWWVGVKPSDRTVRFSYNDGNATALTIATSSNAFTADAWKWLMGTVDRDGNLNLWVGSFATGVLTLAKTSAVSTRTGTWSNSSALWMGNWGADAGNYFKGYLGFVRYNVGSLMTAAWVTKEWERVRWGWPRSVGKFTAMWDFENSLVDSSSSLYTLSYLPSGTASYVNGPPYAVAPLTAPFTKNPDFGNEQDLIDGTDFARTLDGSGQSYNLFSKQRHSFSFSNVLYSQWASFMGAKMSGNEVDVYLDSDDTEPLCTGLIRSISDSKSIPYFTGDEYQRSIALEIEES
jgi:hypothetical protein